MTTQKAESPLTLEEYSEWQRTAIRDLVDERNAVEAERDRLEGVVERCDEELNRYIDVVVQAEAERDRYKAALEAIIYDHGTEDCEEGCPVLEASRTLAGNGSSTTEGD